MLLGAHLESQSRWKLLKVCCLSGRNMGPHVTCFFLRSQETHTNQGKEIECLSLKSHFIHTKAELQAGRLQRGLLMCACVRISPSLACVFTGFLCLTCQCDKSPFGFISPPSTSCPCGLPGQTVLLSDGTHSWGGTD